MQIEVLLLTKRKIGKGSAPYGLHPQPCGGSRTHHIAEPHQQIQPEIHNYATFVPSMYVQGYYLPRILKILDKSMRVHLFLLLRPCKRTFDNQKMLLNQTEKNS